MDMNMMDHEAEAREGALQEITDFMDRLEAADLKGCLEIEKKDGEGEESPEPKDGEESDQESGDLATLKNLKP